MPLPGASNEYSNCSKILYAKVSDKMGYAKSADLDQSDQGLYCLPYH